MRLRQAVTAAPGARRAALRRTVFGGAGRAMERLGLAAPAFRAYERILAARSRRLPRRGKDGLPLPPAHLQVLVSGVASPRFEQKGAEAAASIREILRRTGGDIDGCRAVLDFGVGCGRIARHWARIEGPEWHACDYNPLLVRWCQENLPFLRTDKNELDPPLPYADASFDLVYAYSVFTHLTEPLQHRWMRELVRVIEPGGRIIFSTHGDATRETMEPAVGERYDRGELAVRFAGTPGSNLCSAFHPEEWVRNRLVPELEVLDLVKGGAPGLGLHDIWTVAKPAA
jgi:SAM-dependent methyltransferase